VFLNLNEKDKSSFKRYNANKKLDIKSSLPEFFREGLQVKDFFICSNSGKKN
jgi:UDP-glucose 6-dehydrogenase